MIVVQIDLLPFGLEHGKANLARVEISNDLTGKKPTSGNYTYKIYSRGGKRVWKKGKVKDFPRKRLYATDLLYRVLKDAFGDRNT